MNRAMLLLWKRAGMETAIVDAFDTELHKIARGERPDLEELTAKVEDGEEIDESSLTEEQLHIVKSVRVILGHTLYSDSWLET